MDSIWVSFPVRCAVVIPVCYVPTARSLTFTVQLLGLGVFTPPEHVVHCAATLVSQPAAGTLHAFALEASLSLSTLATGAATAVRAANVLATFWLTIALA